MTPGPKQWLGDDETKPAPEPLVLVQSLINTLELPEGADRLADPADARPWLIDHRLLAAHAELAVADLETLRSVREALRAMLVYNAGGPPPNKTSLSVLRSVAETGTARADLGDDGHIRLTAFGDSLNDRLVNVLLIIRDAQRDGTWARLKACANDECRWAFYDRARNHGGTWCDMAACGNKLKNRAFRARSRSH
ncbi:CGNR zinc finger domain-containing protein [Mycobacterium sp. NPDC048908]|uniref:CGNR zinc finger domain-containing protein n=1 Tax=Mycobacterium sp. NPDC048908 TaxID=3364292 RepID=UPI003722711B